MHSAEARRVFVGPTEVAGVAHGIAEGLRRIGVDAELVLEADHAFGYAASAARGWPVGPWRRLGTAFRARRRAGLADWPAWAALHGLLAWLVLAWAIWRFDTFVYIAGNAITRSVAEWILLRLLGKRVVVVFLGSDARPPYINGVFGGSDGGALAREARRVKRRVTRIERWVSACINAPGTAHFHERAVVNWFAIGFPRFVAAAARGAVPARAPGDRVVLVHSPSLAVAKGTEEIQRIVEQMQARGLPVELRILQGLPNAAVVDALREADLVVDQLYSDTPMAGLATEAAQLARPALVGGYFAAHAARALAGLAPIPSRFVLPEEFGAALEDLVRDEAQRRTLGSAALAFVQDHWSCEQVARRLMRLLSAPAPALRAAGVAQPTGSPGATRRAGAGEVDVPAHWWFDPATVDYLHGCGLSEAAARDRVARLVAERGVGALQLADKPALEAAFVAWARGAGGAA
ncbi:MAG: glycosyltransferase [Ideonella sp.]|nr:glycosyltransferase [Ideonella sp.]